jgi:hypothetical protein
MSDPISTRIANLESVVFGSAGLPTQVVSAPGATPIAVQNNLLVLITAAGGANLSLPSPTAAQNNFAITILNANGAINTVIGAFTGTGTPSESYASLTDSGQNGNICKLVALGGVWQLTAGGVGWGGVAAGVS